MYWRPVQIIALIFLFGALLFGQDAGTKWSELQSKKLKLSVLFPSDYLVDAEPEKDIFLSPNFLQLPSVKNTVRKPTIYSRSKGLAASLSVLSISQTPGSKYDLWMYTEALAKDGVPFQDFRIGKHVGRKFDMDSGGWLGTYIIIAFENKIIRLTVYARPENRMDYQKLLWSLRMNGKQLFDQRVQQSAPLETADIDSMTTSLEIQKLHSAPDSTQQFVSMLPLSHFVAEKYQEAVVKPTILRRKPSYFVPPNTKGSVQIKVTFKSDGTIGPISIYGDVSKALAKSIFEDTRRIKFLPGQSDGKPIDMVMDMGVVFN